MSQVSHTYIHTHTKDGEVYQQSQSSLLMGKIEASQTRVLWNIYIFACGYDIVLYVSGMV